MRRLALAACLAAGALAAFPAAAWEERPQVGDPVVVNLLSGATVRGTLLRDEGLLTLRLADGTEQQINVDRYSSVRRDEAAARQGPAPSGSATAPAAAGPHIGLGVSLPGAGEFPSFYVPIQAGPGFRLEPEIGLVRMAVSSGTATAFQVGFGLLRTWPVAPQVGGYAGLRMQVQRLDATGGESITNLRLAAALGGEWFPVPAVSLGAEGQLAYVSFDKAATFTGSTASGLATGALLFLRVYLR
jgi:hypothetical protein